MMMAMVVEGGNSDVVRVVMAMMVRMVTATTILVIAAKSLLPICWPVFFASRVGTDGDADRAL